MKLLLTILIGLAVVVLLSFLFSYPLMLLWNGCLVPAVPAIREVEWLQMWGINVLVGLMFKSSSSSNSK